MKKISILAFAIVSVLFASALFSFRPMQENKAKATVEQVQGLYIFFLAKPEAQTEYLGTVKAGMTWKGVASEKFNALIKKVKKDYPSAEGILINDADLEKADAIKFK
jgi:hypothetical protein